MKNLEAIAVGFLRFRKDDFVDAERGFIEDDFCLRVLCEVDCLGDKKVHGGNDSCVYKGTDSECEFEPKILDDETGDELAE